MACAEPVLLRTAGETEDDGLPQLGAIWGLEATVGQLVSLSVQVLLNASDHLLGPARLSCLLLSPVHAISAELVRLLISHACRSKFC